MKKIILVIVFLTLTVFSGYCQESKEPLEFTIKSDKEVYGVGEEIKIFLNIKNISKEPIKIELYFWGKEHLACGTNTGFQTPSQVVMLDSNGKDISFSNIAPKALMPPVEFITVAPHETYSAVIPYSKNYQTHKIIPGNYTITVKYNLSALSTLTSNTITIMVVEKKGISKQKAIDIAKSQLRKERWAESYIEDSARVADCDDDWCIDFLHINSENVKPGSAGVKVNKITGEVQWVPSQ